MKKLLRHVGLVFFACMMLSFGLILFCLWLAMLWAGFHQEGGSNWFHVTTFVLIAFHPYVKEIYREIQKDLQLVHNQW